MAFIILYTILRKLVLQHAPRWAPPGLPFMPDDHGGGGGPGSHGPGGGGGGGSGGDDGHDTLKPDDTDLSDTSNPDAKPSAPVDRARTGMQAQPDQRVIPRAGIIGGVLAATGLGALFATRRPAVAPAAVEQRQRSRQDDAVAVAGPSRTQDVAALSPPAARASQRIGVDQAARRRQTYEGFWGVDTATDDAPGGGEMRTATAFGSSQVR